MTAIPTWASLRYPPPGTILLGKYRVEGLIGEGGMGSVVRAMHTELEEPVAIKILLPELVESQDVVRRFLREAKSAAKLKNEHVARIIDVGYLDGQFEGRPYIVMELLEGADLRAIVKHHGPQDPSIAADLLLQACEAIAEAHSLGIIHRDIKPSNFFITRPDGHTPVLKVVDFGIATAPTGTADVTTTHNVVGTPAYMAPEQMRNAKEANARSDVWSLGVVLYETLEGRRPYPQDAYPELILAVGMDPPQPMTLTPEAMRAVVWRCLEKSLDRRYQNVAELARDLVPFTSDPVRARAAAETCVRLLERRKSNVISAPLERAEPISGTPPPLTPHSRLPMPQEMVSATHQVNTRSDRRWLVISASFLVACAVGGGVFLYTMKRDDAPAAAPVAAPKVEAPPPPPPAKVEAPVVETKSEPPANPVDFDEKAAFDSTRESKSEDKPVEDKPVEDKPVAVNKPPVKKPPVKKPPVKKPPVKKPDDDPFSRR